MAFKQKTSSNISEGQTNSQKISQSFDQQHSVVDEVSVDKRNVDLKKKKKKKNTAGKRSKCSGSLNSGHMDYSCGNH